MARIQIDAEQRVTPGWGREGVESSLGRILLISVALRTLMAHPAWAAQWDVTPIISVRETYTDNIALEPDASKRAEWVTQAIPGISIEAIGARLRFDATYTPEFTYYARGEEDNQTYHRLRASGHAELASQLLFVDSGANLDRYNASVQSPIATDNVNVTGNRVAVGSYFVAPYLLHDFGTLAHAEARFTYSVVDSDDPSRLADSAADRIDLRLRSGPAYRLLTWNVEYANETIRYETRPDISTEVIEANGRRLITTEVGLLAQGGYEKYTSGIPGLETKGPKWGGGFEWTPTPRTRVAAIAGERLHNKAYSFDLAHRTRLTTWGITYKEEVTTSRSEFVVPATVSTAGILDELFLAQIPDPVARQEAVDEFIARTGLPPSLGAPVNFFTNDLFLSKRWQVSSGVLGARNAVIASVFRETRERLIGDLVVPTTGDFLISNTIRQTGMSLQWNWRMTVRSAWNLGAGYVRNEFLDSGRVDNLAVLGMGLTRQFQPRLSGSVNYRRQQNDSNEGSANYTENAVIATLQLTL